MARIYDLSLPAGIEAAQKAQFLNLLANTMRPTAAEIDLMARTWIERLGALAGQAVGVAGTEVYIPLAVLETDDETLIPDLEAAKTTAIDAVANTMPNADDLHAVAVLVLGEALATQLGL